MLFLQIFFSLDDLYNFLSEWISTIYQNLIENILALAEWVQAVFGRIGELFGKVGGVFSRIGSAIKNFNWSNLWRELKKWYSRYKKWIAWYKKNILGPIEQMRRNLLHIYDTLLRPILQPIEDLRQMVQVIGIFNRKLAARIDAALFGVEQKLLSPLLATMRQMNRMSSLQRAFITRLGLIDRVTLLTSLRRDWKLLWADLLNAGQLPKKGDLGLTAPSLSDLRADFREFADTGTGPLAETNDALKQEFDRILVELG